MGHACPAGVGVRLSPSLPAAGVALRALWSSSSIVLLQEVGSCVLITALILLNSSMNLGPFSQNMSSVMSCLKPPSYM